MKILVMFSVALTIFLLVLVTVLVSLHMPLNWVLYLTFIGQVFLLIMIYKVLKDNYPTTKTFDDFYEDHPIGEYENYR
jgi:hypothetical protein